ncbi:PREDICTED: phenolic glucoside malonyltransferase 1-like isoform X1 [Tarenaya hassleriana]|uniref:phenolic glucoside malonyltransferase 1-like isoform X2 n=1 Tax=Tarenaya hassleriana TaxID=28532 RepID=UPI00053C2E64|nr:PREDICTED: phenolic glucoside malonyltransferase 1-like isoform X2 [Tarenaya hassleriana]XP_010553963.1 PREDICTED: phenolic glucoside malonyltransferase 1-like isoform X1 [Tarenaya hassleriana]
MASSLNLIHVARVTPSSDSGESVTLPLTFFDALWLKFPPVERLIFYPLTTATRPYFDSVIVPNLKASLSHTLSHYLPLAGRLVLDSLDANPRLVYSANDAVSLTVAEYDADFSHLSGDGPRCATELYPLVPELHISDDSASAVSFQVTLFPDQGFCIGVSAHHAVLDGKTATMFLKAWAHISKQRQHEEPNNFDLSLPQDLIPFYDRTVINAPPELMSEVLNTWFYFVEKFSGDVDKAKPLNLNLIPFPEIGSDVLRYTFELTRGDLQTLRDRVMTESPPEVNSKELRLSTFVLAFSYAFACMVKARGGDPKRPVGYGFAVDCRKIFDPPIPGNYFGNCVSGGLKLNLTAEKFLGEKGFVTAVKMVSDTVAGLDPKVGVKIPEILRGYMSVRPGTQLLSVAGSTRFGVYGLDIGWGRPVKVEIVSIDHGESISMAESRDGSGGVEIGFSLKKHEMDVLIPLLRHGLKN